MEIELKIIGENEKEKAVLYVKELTPEINMIIEQLKSDSNMIAGFKDDEITLLSYSEIILFYASNKKVYAKTNCGSTYQIKKRLYEIEELVSMRCFERLSSSAIGNIKKIRKVNLGIDGGMKIVFVDGTTEFVSRRCITNIKKTLKLGGK